jgi:hypothetical protein
MFLSELVFIFEVVRKTSKLSRKFSRNRIANSRKQDKKVSYTNKNNYLMLIPRCKVSKVILKVSVYNSSAKNESSSEASKIGSQRI